MILNVDYISCIVVKRKKILSVELSQEILKRSSTFRRVVVKENFHWLLLDRIIRNDKIILADFFEPDN